MNIKKDLTTICNLNNGDKGTIFYHENSDVNLAHRYSLIYEKFFEENRDKEINMLEIGLWCPFFPGSSVRIWNEYFTNLNYYGIDIVDCKHLEKDKIKIFIVDQKSEEQLNNLNQNIPDMDYIIDDGCHQEDAIIISLGNLFPKLKSGGIYFIEDLHVVNLENLIKLKEKKLTSKFISKEKLDYINNNIKECDFHLNNKFCHIIKK